jgi:multidrug efflux pump subunit AcrA (membrane-fusion protein)
MFEADGTGSQSTDTQQGGETPPSDGGGTPDIATLQADLAKAQDALKKANAEAADRRKKLQAYEQAQAQRDAAQMSEAEKAQQAADQVKALEAELRKTRADFAIATAAAKASIDPELAARLVDVEFDEAGKPLNIEAALTAALTKYPHLRPAAGSNPANPGRVSKLSLEDVKKMSPAQINARWDEVQAAMKAG